MFQKRNMEFAVHVSFLLTILIIKTRARNLEEQDQIEERIGSESYPEFLPSNYHDLDPYISGQELFINPDTQGRIH